MNISKEKLLDIFGDYDFYFPELSVENFGFSDVSETFCEMIYLVIEVLEAEAKATAEKEPYATNSIQRVKAACDELRFLRHEITEKAEEEREEI